MQFPLVQETTSVAVAVLVKVGLVLVPVTVKTLELEGAAVVVVTVSVEEAAVAGFGLKVPLAPVPRPLTENVTAPVNPPVLVMLTVYVVEAPLATVREVGVIEFVKSPAHGACTPSVAVDVRVKAGLVLVPVIVN